MITSPEDERLDYYAIIEKHHLDLLEVLGLFLNAARCKKFQTAAEEDQDFIIELGARDVLGIRHLIEAKIESHHHLLVERYNRRAEELGVRATFDQTWENRYVKFEHETDVPRGCDFLWFGATREPGAMFEDVESPAQYQHLMGEEEAAHDEQEVVNEQQDSAEAAPLPPSRGLSAPDSFAEHLNDLPPLPVSSMTRRRLKIYTNTDTAEPFQLRPECRKCYEMFASHEGLHHHLQEFPKHQVHFKRKKYNTIHYWARHDGNRKCWTCAKSYVSIEFLNEHLDSCGHRREGMIPRWKVDNGWTNRRDGARNAQRKEAHRPRGEAKD
jgi:hypothetical protein